MITQQITIKTTIACKCGADSLELAVGGQGLDSESPCRSPDSALRMAIESARGHGLTVECTDGTQRAHEAEVFCSKCKPASDEPLIKMCQLAMPCVHCGRKLILTTSACTERPHITVHEWPAGSGTAGGLYWQRCEVAYGGCGWEGSPYPPAKCCPDSHDCPTNALRDDHCAFAEGD